MDPAKPLPEEEALLDKLDWASFYDDDGEREEARRLLRAFLSARDEAQAEECAKVCEGIAERHDKERRRLEAIDDDEDAGWQQEMDANWYVAKVARECAAALRARKLPLESIPETGKEKT